MFKKRALSIHEQRLGAEHSTTAISLYNLAALDSNQGKYEQAESLLVRALAICEQHVGTSHPDIALSRWRLATLSRQQGKLSEARAFYEQALPVLQERFGPQHPQTRALREQYEEFLNYMQP